MFTELCNALSYHLIHEPNTSQLGDLNSVSLLLMCASHPDYEVFQKSFLFWFNISEEIYTNPNSEKLCIQFRDYIYQLIDAICKHCRLEADHESVPPSKSDDFGEFRLKASDLVADIVFIVEANQCFSKMYTTLQNPQANWFEIESALFVMCAFAKSISHDEQHSVVQVVQAILNLPAQVHISVRCTGIKLIGELCDWLNKHAQFIEPALNFVCVGFTQPKLCQVAANTMLSICTQCQQHMVNHLDTLLNIVVSTDSINEMPGEASTELLKGAVVILCNLNASEITAPLMRLCAIQLNGLQKVLSGDLKDLAAGSTKALPLYWLDRFTALFRTVKIRPQQSQTANTLEVHPCQPVVEQCWPTFKLCLQKYQQDSKVTESCCRSLRFALRATEKYSRNILVDVSIMRINFLNQGSG